MQDLLYNRANNFLFRNDTSKSWLKFVVDGSHIGFIRTDNWPILQEYAKGVLVLDDQSSKTVTLNSTLKTNDSRSEALQSVMEALRDNNVFPFLKGWRNEKYRICTSFSLKPLCRLERAACCILGVQKFGSHINGYTKKDGEVLMWLGVRSLNKPTFPGMIDNLAAGGLTHDATPLECAINECEEEAGITKDYSAKHLKYCGSISCCHEDERGVHPETEYVFDLELPPDFSPRNLDGEVESFQLVPVQNLISMVTQPNFKVFSAVVVLDFLVRHGHLTPATPNIDLPYAELVTLLHMRFPFDRM